MNKILFVTNMFPTTKNKSCGSFVKTTYDWLKESYNVRLIKLGYANNKLIKIFHYLIYNLKTLIWGTFGNYDIVYVHYISHSAYSINILKKIKKNIIVVGNVHGDDAFSNTPKFRKNQYRANIFIRNADYIIVPSSISANKLSKMYNFPIDRVYVSPSGGINTSLFYPNNKKEIKKSFSLDNNFVVGFVSRLVDDKGWDTFIRMINYIENTYDINAKYILIGSGPCEKEVDELINQYSLNTKILRYQSIPNNELPAYYNCMDLLCLLSKIKTETLGLIGLEAMACGTPCIITKTDGYSTYSKDSLNSFVVDIDDWKSAGESLIKYYNYTDEMRNVMIENSLSTAQTYDSILIKNELISFFNKVIESKHYE